MIHITCPDCRSMYSLESMRGPTLAHYCPACGSDAVALADTHSMAMLESAERRVASRKHNVRQRAPA